MKIKKYLAFLLALCFGIGIMTGCSGDDGKETTHNTGVSPSLSAYEGYSDRELLTMMCECDCNTLQSLVLTTDVDSVSGIVELGEDCPVIEEFFSRPHSMVSFREYAFEVYTQCSESEDSDIRMNALGFGRMINILCPDLLEQSEGSE